jgi:hypothetical protein
LIELIEKFVDFGSDLDFDRFSLNEPQLLPPGTSSFHHDLAETVYASAQPDLSCERRTPSPDGVARRHRAGSAK